MNKLEEWIEQTKKEHTRWDLPEDWKKAFAIIEHLIKAVEYIADIENRVDFRPIESINFDKILSARKAIEACEREIS